MEDEKNVKNEEEDLMEFKFETIKTFTIAFVLFVFFVFLTILHFLRLHQKILPDMDNWEEINKKITISRFFLFLQIFVCLLGMIHFFVYVLMFNGTQILFSLKIISVAILSIIGATFLLIDNPAFVKIFENTIGFWIVNFIWGKKMEEHFSQILGSNVFKNITSSKTEESEEQPPQAIEDSKISLNFLLTLMNLQNFSEMFKHFSTKTTSDNENKKEKEFLFFCVTLKNVIGHMSWIYFAGLTTFLVCLKFLSKNK